MPPGEREGSGLPLSRAHRPRLQEEATGTTGSTGRAGATAHHQSSWAAAAWASLLCAPRTEASVPGPLPGLPGGRERRGARWPGCQSRFLQLPVRSRGARQHGQRGGAGLPPENVPSWLCCLFNDYFYKKGAFMTTTSPKLSNSSQNQII